MPDPVQGELLPFKVRDRRSPGWYWAQNELVDVWGPVIGSYGLAVYHILARHARDNEVTGLSAARIAELAVISRSKAFETLRNLEEVGLVGRRQRAGGETTYFLLDLKASPVHRADGCGDGNESTVRTTPVRNTDGSPAGVENEENARPVHLVDGGSPLSGLDPSTTRTPNKEARLKTCKTETLKAGAVAPAGAVENANTAREVWRQILVELKGRMDAATFDNTFRDTWGTRIGGGFLFVAYRESKERDLSVMWRFSRDVKDQLRKLGFARTAPHFVRDDANVEVRA